MIQEIYPHKLNNAYNPKKEVQAEDFVICVKENAMMVADGTDRAVFPKRKDLPENFACQYLFSVDEEDFYLAVQEGMNAIDGFTYLSQRQIRQERKGPQEYLYAAITAWHLVTWYRDNRYCGRCGHSTHPSDKERALVCSACGNVIYPRIMPAIIAGVMDGDKILMTKYANRDIPYYALIAGFTEIGETLEECVAREVMEETGIKVKNIRYYASQPWGTVQDLLVGFFCDVDGSTEISLDKNELKEGIWVKREDVMGQRDDYSLTHAMMMAFKEGKEPKN